MRRVTRRETTVLISVKLRVYVCGQKVSFGLLLWAHLIEAGRIPGVGTPEPVTRFRDHPVFSKHHQANQRKSKPSDLRYPFYRPPAPWVLLCRSCSLSCLVLRWSFTLAACAYRLASIRFLRDPIITARGHFSNSQTTGEAASLM